MAATRTIHDQFCDLLQTVFKRVKVFQEVNEYRLISELSLDNETKDSPNTAYRIFYQFPFVRDELMDFCQIIGAQYTKKRTRCERGPSFVINKSALLESRYSSDYGDILLANIEERLDKMQALLKEVQEAAAHLLREFKGNEKIHLWAHKPAFSENNLMTFTLATNECDLSNLIRSSLLKHQVVYNSYTCYNHDSPARHRYDIGMDKANTKSIKLAMMSLFFPVPSGEMKTSNTSTTRVLLVVKNTKPLLAFHEEYQNALKAHEENDKKPEKIILPYLRKLIVHRRASLSTTEENGKSSFKRPCMGNPISR